MLCPSCNQRKARRACPALKQDICPICCGTKRLVEIQCPSNCGYLASAREHPAAVVRRQQERDFAVLLPTIEKLTERQQQLFFLVHSAIARHRPEGFIRLIDDDVAEAAAALASTAETAARGVIYEHAPPSRSAQRLLSDIKGVIAEIRKQATTISDREVAGVLRAIEQGARNAARPPRDDSAYLTLMTRLLRHQHAEEPELIEAPKPAPGLIVP